ncbi:MAG TPA: flavin reductase family protein, partial [Candidatus Polarisedimenticolia bacterium]|nr:flavin reductase family protein [Candidatus Polarisedimenticolia bacterium]
MGKIEIPLSRSLRLIAPGPVTLLTSESHATPNIAACSWAVPISFAPPMIGLSLEPDSLTRRNVEESGEFVLNVPPRALAQQT